MFRLADLPRHSEITNLAHTHLVNHDILQLNVTVDISRYFVHVLQSPYYLSEHGTHVILW